MRGPSTKTLIEETAQKSFKKTPQGYKMTPNFNQALDRLTKALVAYRPPDKPKTKGKTNKDPKKRKT